jgi:hypothetical protein
MIRITFSTQKQQVTVRIIYNIAGLDKQYFPNDLISSNFCCCPVENAAYIMHHTAIFVRLQCPRVLAARNKNPMSGTYIRELTWDGM